MLEKALAQGETSHAYLLVGSPQVGKGTLALNLAQALNCREDAPPCGECSSCRRIAAGLHPDVQSISLMGEGARGRPRVEIGIDVIRELQRSAALNPFEGRCRVFIIDGAERLSTDAANCLLKTLEEPPPQVVLVLLASDTNSLLPTVLSRCQRVELLPLPREAVQAALESRWGAEREKARLLASLCQGRLGWAVAALQDSQVLQSYQEERDRLAGLVWEALGPRLAQADDLSRRAREGLNRAFAAWLGWWRDLLLVKGGAAGALVNLDAEDELKRQAEALSLGEVFGFVRSLVRAQEDLGLNVNHQLCVEALMLQLPRLERAAAAS